MNIYQSLKREDVEIKSSKHTEQDVASCHASAEECGASYKFSKFFVPTKHVNFRLSTPFLGWKF